MPTQDFSEEEYSTFFLFMRTLNEIRNEFAVRTESIVVVSDVFEEGPPSVPRSEPIDSERGEPLDVGHVEDRPESIPH